MVLGYNVDVAVLVIPVTTLFAFTSLRGSMPGAPAAFGASYRSENTPVWVLTMTYGTTGANIGRFL